VSVQLVLAGGYIHDGLGTNPKLSDVVVSDGIIVDIAEPRQRYGPSFDVIDVRGLAVAPGFIDVHSHADNASLLDKDDTSKILQGVTTEIIGNCGYSLAPIGPPHVDAYRALCARLFPPFSVRWTSIGEYFAALEQAGSVTNLAPLVGHGSVRTAIMGTSDASPGEAELIAMRGLVRDALDAGAFGMSSGLIYPPGAYSKSSELHFLARELPAWAVYASHIRGEGDYLFRSLNELVDLAQATGAAAQVSHLKCAGTKNWGLMESALELLDVARSRGLRIGQDTYP
jgi:N-acyl-D-amino-acid deacylase